jgi:hypothetical protein
MAEEESRRFPEFLAFCSVEEDQQLLKDYNACKANAPTNPHSSGPNTGIAAKIMQPLVGAFDRNQPTVANK